MWYIVDGYNFAHQAGLFSGEVEAIRQRVVNRIGGLAGRQDRVTVVWDAREKPPGAPRRVRSGIVEQLFAQGDGSADETIIALVREASDTGGICVVTDDLGVSRPARNMGARVLSVQEAGEKLHFPRERRQRHEPSKTDDMEEEKPMHMSASESEELQRLFEEGWNPEEIE